MSANPLLAPGLPDVVHGSQQTFRAVLDALARPGTVCEIGEALPDVALGGAMARVLLSLTDDETPVWWQRADPTVQRWLQFHTGAGVAANQGAASFAVLHDMDAAFDLANFAMGSAESPEFSTTLIVELPALHGGPELEWRGPGIEVLQRVGLCGVPSHFWSQWQANHAAFPAGVDLLFTCGDRVLGLPRTTRVRRLEGV